MLIKQGEIKNKNFSFEQKTATAGLNLQKAEIFIFFANFLVSKNKFK